eukprot:scaffold35193_cov31-Tisochrysis_lutea.AAC.2
MASEFHRLRGEMLSAFPEVKRKWSTTTHRKCSSGSLDLLTSFKVSIMKMTRVKSKSCNILRTPMSSSSAPFKEADSSFVPCHVLLGPIYLLVGNTCRTLRCGITTTGISRASN